MIHDVYHSPSKITTSRTTSNEKSVPRDSVVDQLRIRMRDDVRPSSVNEKVNLRTHRGRSWTKNDIRLASVHENSTCEHLAGDAGAGYGDGNANGDVQLHSAMAMVAKSTVQAASFSSLVHSSRLSSSLRQDEAATSSKCSRDDLSSLSRRRSGSCLSLRRSSPRSSAQSSRDCGGEHCDCESAGVDRQSRGESCGAERSRWRRRECFLAMAVVGGLVSQERARAEETEVGVDAPASEHYADEKEGFKLLRPYSPGGAPAEGDEEETSSSDAAESDAGSRGLTARNLVGTYAASTALAVQESLPPEGVIVLLACLVGVLTGGSVVLFNLAVHRIHDEVWEGIPGSGAAWLRTRPLNETWVQLLAVPFGGGVLVGLLNTMRHSLNDDIENDESKVKAKSPRLDDLRGILRAFLKAMGAAVTLGTGCSLGPEGPSVEIGASIANGVGTVLSNSRERKLSLVAAGSAAGISSGFNAAVAGCFFALESVLRPASSDSAPSLTTAMLLLSSVLASVISQAGLGSDPAFKIPVYDFRSPAELPLYLLLGILSGSVSATLVKGNAYATTMFENVRKTTEIPAGFLPPVGGLAVGVIALAYPEILYWGFENVDTLLESRPWVRGPSVELLLQLVGVKVIATSLCRGSGLVGGMYAPSLFIGAALGSAYGSIARNVFSHADPAFHLEWLKVAAPQAYALVGMAAMLAGVCQVPLTSVLLLFELTRDYRIILPLMGAVGLSSWIASSFTKKNKRSSKSEFAPPSPPSALVLQPQPGSASKLSSALFPNAPSQQSLLSNGVVGNGDRRTTPKEVQEPLASMDGKVNVYMNDGNVEAFVEETDLCNIDESLCLANFEISEEQLAEEIPVSMAMRTRFATLSPDSTVREAMSAMVLEKEWCVLLVDSNRRLSGLLTLADIQQAAGNATSVNRQMEVESKPVSALLKSRRLKQVVTATKGMSLRAAQRLMAGRGLRQIPVVDVSQRVVGLLDRDSIALACRAEATRRLLGLSLCITASEDTNEGL